ncbi:MAG: PLP-dependent transferase [Deltaproteobacteria bacterium]|nr:PLP-dependent transferase [Deltaproteobacteria bacterium]MBK8235831.1 PLP-dependent transferase [Deltaproteobacteria bacterium]MBK8713460.1 PLP-dependent transferase [Deltaproteobacteria bacterium]MBP7288085.1 PLP-dependent transferase [Nannocystaceae bacterium]
MARIDTDLIHAGEPRPRIAGAVVAPIFQSSTFAHSSDPSAAAGDYHDLRYLRLSNSPTHQALHAKLAVLEGAEAGLVAASGMAAITTTLLSVLRSGDHVIAQRCLYGGTHDFMTQDLAALGISVTFVGGDDREGWAQAVRPTTRVFYCESLTNPTLELADLRGIAGFARERGLISMIDNTFATPVNLRPVALGFDLVLHSATKYLNGHSDLVAGAVMGRAELVAGVHRKLNHLGGSLDPHAAFLLQRGLKTLAVRVRHHNASALALARMLATHPRVLRVRYPGLADHPAHARARELLTGFGGMLSFELHGGAAVAHAVIAALRLPVEAPSLGGPETLVTRPAATSHVGLDPATRASLGITDALVRVSVGLEDADDLCEDFTQALARA